MCKTRKGAATFVCTVSMFAAITAVLCLLATFGVFDSKKTADTSANVKEIANTVKGAAGALHGHAGAILVMSIFGMSMYKIRNKCCIMIFGFDLGLVVISSLITGGIFSATAIAAPMIA